MTRVVANKKIAMAIADLILTPIDLALRHHVRVRNHSLSQLLRSPYFPL